MRRFILFCAASVWLIGTAATAAVFHRPPSLSVTPATLTFNAPQGGPNPAPQTMVVRNSGTGGQQMNWSATDNAPWLSMNPNSGQLGAGNQQNVAVSVNVGGLTPGTYNATITVTANTSNSPDTVAVTLVVSALPALSVSPSSLTFNAPQGGPNPAPQTVTVSNTGGGTLNWTASDNQTWLSVTPTSGNLSAGASQPMSVSVNVTSPAVLAAGTYNGTVTVTASGATGSPQTVAVTLVVSAVPVLSVTPLSLAFSAPVGGPNPAPQPVTVSNTGSASLTWAASDVETWLNQAPAGGSLSAGASSPMSVSVDVTGLAIGTYNDTITVTAPGATGSPRLVSVTLQVSAAPDLSVSPATLTFNAPELGPNPPTQALTVSNTGGLTLTWSSTSDATWLTQTPASGSLSAGASMQTAVGINVTGLTVGTYTGTITISDPNATNSPQVVSVTLNVSAAPTIGLNPVGLTFYAPVGGPSPAPVTVAVTNEGGGTLSWSATDNQTWLSVSPTSGSLAAGASESMSASVNVTSLAVGTYSGTITVSAAGAANTPQAVTVTLNVVNQPIITLNPTTLTFASPGAGANPPAQAISVTNSGTGTLNWTASADGSWLTLSPTSGSLVSVQSAPITVSVNAGGLGPGTHTALITLVAPGAANTPQTEFVTLVISSQGFGKPKGAGHFCGSGGPEILALLGLYAWLRRRRRGGGQK